MNLISPIFLNLRVFVIHFSEMWWCYYILFLSFFYQRNK